MGGYGSGRCGFNITTKVDGGLRLDINRLRREGQLALNIMCSGYLEWTVSRTGKRVASIGYEANTINHDDMWIRIYYTHTPHNSNEPEKMDYKIRLTTTRPNYGGKRLWFVCPLTQERTSVLYSPVGSKLFASRHAFNFKYQSQSRSAHDRAIDKRWKLRNRLGGDDYWLKPKGMHQKTYELLLEAYANQESVCLGYLAQYIEKVRGRVYA